MPPSIRALLAVDAGLDAKELSDLFPSDETISVVGVVEGLDESWRTLQDATVDLLVVACLGYSDRALFLIDGAVKQDPQRPVVVLTQGSPNGFVRRVFEAGADDILMLPQSREQLRFSISKVFARKERSGTFGGVDLARLIVVLGPKGGTGKTLTSANLAVALAEVGQRVVLVDLDLQFGDVALCLGLTPTVTIHDLARAGGTLDADKLEDYLVSHPSGARVLLAPSRPDQASAVTTQLVQDVYAILRLRYDFVIVDTPPGFTAEVITSIDASTDLVMVGMLDSLSLKNTKLGLETLELMGYSPERIKIVLNRAGTHVGISTTDVVSVLGSAPDVFVPSDREIPRAVNEGVPIIEAKTDSDAAASFRQLASLFVDTAAPMTVGGDGAPAPRRRLFGRKG